MLAVEGLRSRYGRIEVLHGIDLAVGSGEIVTVVGANGAGKTTLLRCLSGVQPVSAGQITFRGEVLTKVPAFRRIQRGLAQSRRICGSGPIFSRMTAWPATWKRLLSCSRSCARNAISPRADCRAGNSKCWPSPAP